MGKIALVLFLALPLWAQYIPPGGGGGGGGGGVTSFNSRTGAVTLTLGDTLTSSTAGSLLFVGAGPALAQDNSNFNYLPAATIGNFIFLDSEAGLPAGERGYVSPANNLITAVITPTSSTALVIESVDSAGVASQDALFTVAWQTQGGLSATTSIEADALAAVSGGVLHGVETYLYTVGGVGIKPAEMTGLHVNIDTAASSVLKQGLLIDDVSGGDTNFAIKAGFGKWQRQDDELILGSTSGTVTIHAQAVAGTPTVTWGTSTGTPAVTASAPLAINATTGNITCTTCGTGNGTVTSVGLLGTANQLTVTGTSPITTSGSFTLSLPSVLTLPGTVNKLTLTAPVTAATLTLADNSSLITSGAFASTFTMTGTTGVTFPTTGTLATLGANTFTALQTHTQASANAGIIASTGYSLTGSSTVSMVDLAGTLNTSGSPDVFAMRITDTARGASTKLFNIYAGASGVTSEFSVDRSGNTLMAGNVESGNGTSSSANFHWFQFKSAASTYTSYLESNTDGIVTFYNSAGSGFTRLRFAGTTSSFGGIGVTNQVNPQILIVDGAGGFTADLKTRSVIGAGASPSVGTCGTIGTGSTNSAGFITSATTGACVSVLTFSATTAPTGWSCAISDATTANLITQTGSSTTTATFSGTTATGDVLRYACTAY